MPAPAPVIKVRTHLLFMVGAILLPAAWARVRESERDVDGLFAGDVDGARFASWMESASQLLGNYFDLEDPARQSGQIFPT